MKPGGMAQAPGELALIQAFANSKDLLTAQDVFVHAERLRTWLITRGLLAQGDTLSEDDFHQALAFREALRALIGANTGMALDAQALALLDQTARRAQLALRFAPDGRLRLEPAASGVDGALGRLLASLYRAMIEGTWARLKSCRSEACQWVYYDASKNCSGTWCAMAICGNRLKVHTYHRRRKAREAR